MPDDIVALGQVGGRARDNLPTGRRDAEVPRETPRLAVGALGQSSPHRVPRGPPGVGQPKPKLSPEAAHNRQRGDGPLLRGQAGAPARFWE